MSLWLAGILAVALSWPPVTPEQLRMAQTDDSVWLNYGRNYAGWRYSALDQINTANVKSLTPRWIFQTGVPGKFETTPLIFNGLMFLTGPSNWAWALDLPTGRPIWRYSKPVPAGVNVCCGQVNRGFAVAGERLFKVNLEAALVALDARTGALLWETQIDEFKKGYSATVAPLVIDDLVLIGIAGAEFGVRAFIDAYHVDTGKRAWRFWTVADPDDPVGGPTWGGDSWKHGGGSTWITGTYDPELGLVYWGTGNPAPDMDGDVRPGDNLYTCALVALEAKTGKMKWHYQFTPHDVHDWDAISDPVLIDLEVEGRPVKAVVQANRNGFYYVLDRTDGRFLLAKPYTQVSWAKEIDAKGRPVLVPGQDPTEEGQLACPSLAGGHNWQATTYSPQTGLYYFNSTEGCQTYFKTELEFVEGAWYMGSTVNSLPTEPLTGAILAVEPATGEIKWRFPLVTPPTSGLLSTAGGLLFAGDSEGYIFAMDARSGEVLWKFQSGGVVIGPPITYTFNGRQQVAVPAGSSMMVFQLPEEGR